LTRLPRGVKDPGALSYKIGHQVVEGLLAS
jgi:hypothetical protein